MGRNLLEIGIAVYLANAPEYNVKGLQALFSRVVLHLTPRQAWIVELRLRDVEKARGLRNMEPYASCFEVSCECAARLASLAPKLREYVPWPVAAEPKRRERNT